MEIKLCRLCMCVVAQVLQRLLALLVDCLRCAIDSVVKVLQPNGDSMACYIYMLCD